MVISVFCARGPLPASPPLTDSLTSTSFTVASNLWTARDTLASCTPAAASDRWNLAQARISNLVSS